MDVNTDELQLHSYPAALLKAGSEQLLPWDKSTTATLKAYICSISYRKIGQCITSEVCINPRQ